MPLSFIRHPFFVEVGKFVQDWNWVLRNRIADLDNPRNPVLAFLDRNVEVSMRRVSILFLLSIIVSSGLSTAQTYHTGTVYSQTTADHRSRRWTGV